MPQRVSQRENQTDPTMTRRGLLAHPGSLATTAAALAFGAYVFNIGGFQQIADSFLGGLTADIQSRNDAVVHVTLTAIPFVAAFIVFLIAYMILRWLGRQVRYARKSVRLSGRASLDSQDFVAFCQQHDISAKVATHAYRLLKPLYHGDVRARMEDNLRRDLHMADHQVATIMGKLLFNCDRRQTIDTDPDEIRTVGDLLKYVEQAPRQSVTQSMIRQAQGEKNAATVSLTPAVGETRMVLPLHKRPGAMAPPPSLPPKE
jgi:hypothetical protein